MYCDLKTEYSNCIGYDFPGNQKGNLVCKENNIGIRCYIGIGEKALGIVVDSNFSGKCSKKSIKKFVKGCISQGKKCDGIIYYEKDEKKM